jgi:hypothetical protein
VQSIRWLSDRKGIENITETWGEAVVDRKARKAVQDEQYSNGDRLEAEAAATNAK